MAKIFDHLFGLFFCFTVLQKCGYATEHVFIPSFLSMKLLHKIVEIYASIKGLHELQTKYCHNVCASFSPRIQGTINIKGTSVFTILKVRRYHTLILFLSHKKLLSKLALVQVLAWECNILLLHFQITCAGEYPQPFLV